MQEEQPDAPIANHFLEAGDPGALVSVAGAGILASSDQSDDAERFVEFLLSDEGQRFYVDAAEEAEYPLVAGIDPKPGLPPIQELAGPGCRRSPASAPSSNAPSKCSARPDTCRETEERGHVPPLLLVLAASVIVALAACCRSRTS